MKQNSVSESSLGRLFVPSLSLVFLSTWIIESLTGIFLIDVAETFFGSSGTVELATTSQLVTISSVVSVIFAVVLGFLSVKYSHKGLMLMGSLAVTAGIVGCFFAPDFLFMQVFFPIEGIGTTVITAMAFTLVGESLAVNKRPKAIGWILAGSYISSIVGSLMISLFFSGTTGWRQYLLCFALPISIVSLVAVHFWVPSKPQKPKDVKKEDYLDSFKQIFLNKSAASCLIGVMFKQAGFVWITVYNATFFRTQFGLSLSSAALIGLVGGVIVVFSEIAGGHLGHRVGRKRLLIATLLLSSPFLVIIAFVPSLWIVLLFSWIGAFIYAMNLPASNSLMLEQAPKSRGTMMSMSTIFVTFGTGLGAAIGGAALITLGWTGLILILSSMQLIAATIIFFLTKDPCRP